MSARIRIVAMWLLVALGALCASTARAALHVIPFPRTPDASPSSAVIFSALRPSDLRTVTVTGSRSGSHSGRISALPVAGGMEFTPNRQFAFGELVHVSATLNSVRAGAAEGDPGSTRVSFSFRVRVPPPAPLVEGPRATSTSSHGPTQSFHTQPDFHPPTVTLTSDRDRTSADIFAGILFGPQGGPMILDPEGQLVWFLPGREAANFEVQHYQGAPVLTWWQKIGSAPAEDVIMNRSYRTVAIVHGSNGFAPDAHEFLITPQGTAFLSTVEIVSANLTSVGGPANGTALDDVVQEVDVRTGQLLWEWHSLGHVPLSASYGSAPQSSWPPYDFFHLNSIQQLPNGNLLISARQTWAVYEISRQTGRVIWSLGGKHSDFAALGPGTGFEWQHDARLNGQTLSVFDDASTPQEESQSSAKFLRLDIADRTVSLIRRFTHFPPVLTPEMGSVQTLPDGNVFVGWGKQPQFSEYTPSGRQILNGSFPLGLVFYRIFRFPWVGHPHTRPAVAVSRGPRGLKVYASWNGATQVTAWRLLEGSTPHQLKQFGVSAPRTGFETTIHITTGARYLAVQALSRRGTVLGTSAPARAPR